MLTKNLTPFLCGAKACYRRPRRPEMTLFVKGTFSLAPDAPVAALEDQGSLTAEAFHEGDEERLGECLYPGDFADWKPNAEVLLRGACHAPAGRPVTEHAARFGVGAWAKELRVVGPRVWTDGVRAKFSEPLPFTRMELSYANAFGGPGYAPNPAGKGWKTPELPTVEAPDDRLEARSQTPEPASFGPLNPAWAQRAGKVGKDYGKRWLAERAPAYAADFDWSHFSAAPSDQQLSGYLRGDEDVTLQGLHPAARSFTRRLPGLRVRVFVKDVEERFREVPMSLDTLYVDAGEGTMTLTWRGLDAVREQDLTDVAHVLVASEKLDEAALPASHYQGLLEAFARDPVGLEAKMEPALAKLAELGGVKKPPLQRAPDEELSAWLERRMRAGFDDVRSAQLGQLAANTRSAKIPPARLEDALARAEQEDADTPPFPRVRKPGAMPSLGLGRKMRAVQGRLDEMKQSLSGEDVPASKRAEIEEMERNLRDPSWAKLDPGFRPPGPVSADEPGPGRDLSDQDLSHRDLSGMDLTSAILVSTVLTGANLRGAKLTGANLRFAVLFKADLTDADLGGADLTYVNAAQAHAPRARLAGANLDLAFLEGANLEGANLEGAKGEYTVFSDADLTGAALGRATFHGADFTGAKVERASFAGASMLSCTFEKCRGKGADFTGAALAGARFPEAELPGARFVEAQGDRTYWMKATLDEANFSYATMRSAHFTEASANGTSFYRANLREGRFHRASLEGAELVEANLFSADLCKTRLAGARFTGANLYDAKLLDAAGAGSDFTGANLKRSLPERT